MRLGGRLQAAIEILQVFESKKRPVGEIFKDWGRSHRFAGSKDRAAIGHMVYDVLRQRASLAYLMDSDKASDLVFAAFLKDANISLSQLDDLLSTESHLIHSITEPQRHAWQSRDLSNAPFHIKADVPSWIVPFLPAYEPLLLLKEMEAYRLRPGVDLRLNFLKKQAKAFEDLLCLTRGMIPQWFVQALRIKPVKGMDKQLNLQNHEAYLTGLFEIQDLGSQILAHLAGVEKTETILDYCAGAGGKSLAFAASMENQGKIYAFDADKKRLKPIFNRIERAGVCNIQVIQEKDDLKSLIGKIDRVICDVPCSGSGTWRRHPDTKWLLSEKHLQQRQESQFQILEEASIYLKPRGKLIYMTCSLFPCENDYQIKKFLKTNGAFSHYDMRMHWKKDMGEEAPMPYFTEYGIALSPFKTNTDGFYFSILEKR